MEIGAIVIFSLFIIIFLSNFGSKIIDVIRGLFSDSFLQIPLSHLSFLSSNIDNIAIIATFFMVGIFYVVYYDVDLGKSQKNVNLASEKHKITLTESMENDKEVIKGIDVSNVLNDALKTTVNIDIERDLQVAGNDNICNEPNIIKLKNRCSLLKKTDSCNNISCCMWCNKKQQCTAAKDNAPIFDDDLNCN